MGFEEQSRLRVLIVRVGAMGDVLHGLPAVAALREAVPDCFIGWAIEPRWRALLRSGSAKVRGAQMPIVDRVHEVQTQVWKKEPFSAATVKDIAKLRRELRGQRYDVCVDLQGSIRSAVIGKMAGARRFVGPQNPREGLARTLYGERVGFTQTHVIGQACELLSAAVKREIKPAAVTLPVDVEAEVWADYLLHKVTSPVALIVPSAGWGAKEWGVEKYRELAARLSDAGVKVVVNASARGDAGAESIAASGGGIVAAMNMRRLIALSRRVSLALGGDTGPIHLAAALGKPVVALFGPTDPARNGPSFPGAKVTVLRDVSSTTDHKRHAETEAGLARVTVDEVVSAAMSMIENGDTANG